MKWTYTIKNKLSASLVLLTLCLLVLLSNYLDRLHTRKVKNYIATLYDDRLVAEDLILKMTSNIYQIREASNSDLDPADKFKSFDKSLDDFNNAYRPYIQTKLTPTEKKIALQLREHVKNIRRAISRNNYSSSKHTGKALLSLNKLSEVQIEESKLIMKRSESEYAAIKTTSQFAVAILIIILLVLQAMVFSSKIVMPVKKSNAHLN